MQRTPESVKESTLCANCLLYTSFVPIDIWVFKIDQDELPEWIKSDPEKYEAMARDAVNEWAEKHIFIGIDKLNLTDGSEYYLKDCTNVTSVSYTHLDVYKRQHQYELHTLK